MNIATLVVASFVIALILTLLVSFGFQNRGPWGRLWISFLITFLGIWAASLWLPSVGPVFYGVAWIPLLVAGILISILLTTVGPASKKSIKKRSQRKIAPPVEQQELRKEEARDESITLGMLFWAFIIVLVIAILLGHILR